MNCFWIKNYIFLSNVVEINNVVNFYTKKPFKSLFFLVIKNITSQRGSNLGQPSVTYYLNGPYSTARFLSKEM